MVDAVATRPAGPQSGAPGAAVTGAMAFAVAAVALMQTISIPLIPVLPEAFDTSIAAASWVATATLITGAAVNPIIGRMGDMYGKRLLLIGCLAAAVVGSVVGALADTLLVVIAARAIQGVGSGVIPLAYGVLRDEVPGPRLSRAVAVITAAGAGIGAGLGPVVMGVVLARHGWPSVFWITGALLLAALAVVAAATRRGGGYRVTARFDVPGAVVLAAVLVLLLIGITNGSSWGWVSAPVIGSFAASVVLLVWWVRWERGRPEPMVDLALNFHGMVLIAHLGGLMVGFAMFGQYIASFTLVSLPAGTGYGLGRSLAVAGLVQLPGAIALTVAVAVARRISAVRGSASLLRIGAAVITGGFALAVARHGSLADVVLSVTVVSAGLGIAHCAVPLILFDHVGMSETSAVNAMSALARVVGSVLASALVTAVMTVGTVAVAGGQHPAEWTLQAAYVISAVPAVAVLVLGWRRVAFNSS